MMMQYDVYTYLWIFFIYAFIGWCCEVAFVTMTEKRFVNRGVLNGPLCPIYGVGMAIVVFCLRPIAENPWLLFFGSMLLTSALEFLTGFVLEKFFHEKWWDYSNEPFNLKGYICLRFSVLWGLGCLLVMNVFHPLILKLIGCLDNLFGCILLGVCAAAFLADLIVTAVTLLQLRVKLRLLSDLEANLRKLSDNLGEGISKGAFSTVKAIDEHREEIDRLKNRYADGRAQIKEKLTDSHARTKARYEQLKERYDRVAADRKRLSRRFESAFPALRTRLSHREHKFSEWLSTRNSKHDE